MSSKDGSALDMTIDLKSSDNDRKAFARADMDRNDEFLSASPYRRSTITFLLQLRLMSTALMM